MAHRGVRARGVRKAYNPRQSVLDGIDLDLLPGEIVGLIGANGVLLVRDLIAEQKSRGAMVLLSSHQLAEIEKVCDRVVFLRGGTIARVETLRRTGNYEVAVRFLAGAFDAAAVERIAGRAPQGD